jgi:hypothetical protein
LRGKDPFAALAIDAIRDEIAHYCDLGDRVINQARRRVLDGEQIPNAGKKQYLRRTARSGGSEVCLPRCPTQSCYGECE